MTFLNEEDDNISGHVRYLTGRVSWEDIQARFFKNSPGLGGAQIQLPGDVLDILTLQLNTFARIASCELPVKQFSLNYFRGGAGNLDTIHDKLLTQMLRPFISDLRRYIKKNYDDEPPIKSAAAPASDRIVSLRHNSQHAEIIEAIEAVEESVRGSNDFAPDDKEQISKELQAGRILLSGSKARLSALATTLVIPLKWLSEKVAMAAIGVLAKDALEKLWLYLPNLIDAAKSFF